MSARRALLIVAHGSRRAESNAEVRDLTRQVQKQSPDRFEWINCAFLELAEPSIPEELEQLIRQGATDITVVPYFLSAGRHVAEDIPGEVAKVTTCHPEITIRITPHLGLAGGVAGLIAGLA